MKSVNKLISQVGGLALLAIVVVMTATSFTRYLLNWPLPDADAISRMLLAVVVFWGMASACLHREHIQLDLLTALMPFRLRRVVLWISDLLLMAALVLMAWLTARRILDLRVSGEKTYDLGLQLWPFYGLAYLGLIAAAAFCVTNLLGLTGRAAPRSETDDAIERANELNDEPRKS